MYSAKAVAANRNIFKIVHRKWRQNTLRQREKAEGTNCKVNEREKKKERNRNQGTNKGLKTIRDEQDLGHFVICRLGTP